MRPTISVRWAREVESQRCLGLLRSLAFLSATVFPLADVNVAFQQSAHKVLLDDDNLLPLLHLTIEYHGKEHKGLPFFLASFCSYGFIICYPIRASTHLHRNHFILDLRSHVVWGPILYGRKGKSREARQDAQTMVFLPCCWKGLYFQQTDF